MRLVSGQAATSTDRAKAYYVRSLASLKDHLESKSEASLLRCQSDLLTSVRLAPVYVTAADKVFSYATDFPWKNAESHRASQQLREELEQLTRPE